MYLQIYASQFMTSWIIPFPFTLLNQESVERKGKKLQKFDYLENEKSFWDEIENIFHSFWRPIIWSKIKIWYKIADTSFKYLWPFSGHHALKEPELPTLCWQSISRTVSLWRNPFQCYLSVTPENIRKPLCFRGYREGNGPKMGWFQ